MQVGHKRPNESAATFKWLVAQLGLDQNDPTGPVSSAWSDALTTMRRASSSGQRIVQSVDWISDFWVARGAAPALFLGSLAPTWMPPAEITHWPAFDAEDLVTLFADRAAQSNHSGLVELIAATTEPDSPEETASAALAHYLELKSALVPREFDLPGKQTEHVRAWLAASVGHLLMFAALSPQSEMVVLAKEVVRRLGIARFVAQQRYQLDQIGDRHLEVLYNARMLPDGRVSFGAVRVGQGEEWRDHWLSMGFDLEAEDTLDAVQMAARLLRCPTLVLGLASALASDDGELRLLATAVLRRWLLTLQAMAWLETALLHPWSDIRPKDLCCFALNATKPDWPRRVVAISHRSKDAKPELRGMHIWKAGRVAIDANYAPSWETNIGMIWGLFAPTPVIVRIHSLTYRESLWCRRELELTDYVLKQSDFLTQRWIIDIEQRELSQLDTIVQAWSPQGLDKHPRPLPEFPPLTEVCSPSPMPAWEVRMLRAGAALREIHVALPGSTPEVVNRLALYLQTGGELPPGLPPPTNNPEGWREYGDVFREVNEISGAAPDELAVRLPSDYGQSQQELDVQMQRRIPDLQTGSPALRDVLVALEWLRVEYPRHVERGRGDYLAVNCQRLTNETWKNDERVSLHRGLAAMRAQLPVPLWIIQHADQDAEFWPLIGEVPIFTEHAAAQFGWMMEASFDRHDSQRRYAQDSGLTLAPALEAKCRGIGAHPTSQEATPPG
jgi:hypothetical protein